MEALVSTRLGASNRIGLLYQPTFFRTQQQDFHSNYFALMLDSEPSEKLSTHAEIDGEQYFGAPAQADGTLELRYRVRPSFQLEAKAQREIVDDSLLSTRGELVGGLFLGQVRSNLAMVGGAIRTVKRITMCRWLTPAVPTRAQSSFEPQVELGRQHREILHSYHPYLRIAYAMTYLSFRSRLGLSTWRRSFQSHRRIFQPDSVSLELRAGLCFAQFGTPCSMGRRRTLGVQNSETTFSLFSKAQFASTFSAHLIWTVNPTNEFRTDTIP